MENRRYIDQWYSGPRRFEGCLKKLKSKNSYSRIFTKFNKRFFFVDLDEYIIAYKSRASSKKLKKFSLFELDYIDSSPKITEPCDWKFAFAVKMQKKLYTLYSDTYKSCQQWCEILMACTRPLERSLYNTAPKKGIFPNNEICSDQKTVQYLAQTPKFNNQEDPKNKKFCFGSSENSESPENKQKISNKKILTDVSNLSNKVIKGKLLDGNGIDKEKEEKIYSFNNSLASIHSFERDSDESDENLVIERPNKSQILKTPKFFEGPQVRKVSVSSIFKKSSNLR
jgi:hypothetical protein